MSLPDISTHNAELFEMSERVADYLGEGLWHPEELLIDKYFPKPPAAVLDLGCGTGRTTVGLAARGYRVVGVDLSESMIARARAMHPDLDFRVMDASRLAFDPESFDAAMFSFNGMDLIYPINSRIACLVGIARVLRPRGGFVSSTHSLMGHLLCGRPFGAGTWRQAARFVIDQLRNPVRAEGYWRVPEGDAGLWLWTYMSVPSTLLRQLADAGFVDIDLRTLHGDPRIGRLGWRTVHTYFGGRRAV
jgi:ubiquinone/menaquinone biosynthesis C-methylase UbiE